MRFKCNSFYRYIRHIRVPGGEDWRIYNIRIEYFQHTSNGYIPSAELNFTTPKHG